ncbi:MAG: alpha/beta hydrolase [Bacteroidota bacterium]
MKKFLLVLFLLLGALIITYFAGPKAKTPELNTTLPMVSNDLEMLENEIMQNEMSIESLKDDVAAKIVWYDTPYVKTKYSLVYLHGYSATHPEGDSITYQFAKRYGCNLFLSRIYGHGLEEEEPMLDVTPEKLMESAKMAVAVGKELGEHVILMSTSTGGTFSAYITSGHPEIFGQIMYSPNFDLFDESSKILVKPWGLQLARQVTGSDYHEYDNSDNPGKRFWTNKYRLEAVIALRSLIDATMQPETFQKIETPVFIGYYYKNDSLKDDAVSIPAMKTMFEELGTPPDRKRIINFPEAGTHVIASKYHSKAIDRIREETFAFAEEVLLLEPIEYVVKMDSLELAVL